MSLLSVIATLIVVGVILWLINTYIPMDNKIKTILNVVVVLMVVFMLLRVFGIVDSLSGIRIGK